MAVDVTDKPQVQLSARDYEEVNIASDYDGRFNGLWIGQSGDVAISKDGGTTIVTFKNVPVGFFSVDGNHIDSALTTADDIVAVGW